MTLIILNMVFMMMSHHRQSKTVTNALDILLYIFKKICFAFLFYKKTSFLKKEVWSGVIVVAVNLFFKQRDAN